MSPTAHDLQHTLEEALHGIEEHIPFYLRRWWRWPAIALAAVVVPIALGLGAFRLVAPQVPGYKAEVEARASAVIGFPVAIQDMYLSWYWFGPEVVMREVRVLEPAGDGALFGVDAVRVAVSPLDFLRGGAWRPGRVLFERPVLALTVTSDQRVLLGQTVVGDLTQPTADWRTALGTLLQHGHLEARGATVTFLDQRRLDGPLEFRGDLALDTDGEEHELELALELPAAVGRELRVDGVAVGAPGAPETWAWESEVEARDLQVGWLRTRFDAGDDGGFDGELDVEATAIATGARLDRLDGHIAMGALRAAGAASGAVDAIDALESGVGWTRTADGWTLALERLQVRRGGQAWQPGGLQLGFARDPAGAATLSGEAGYLRVEDLELIASWLPTRVLPIGPALHRLAPRGEVTGLRFELAFSESRVLGYALRAGFDGLGFEAVDGAPGARGLAGRLEARTDGGALTLDARGATLDFGDLFRGPLPAADALAARLSWRREDGGWAIEADDLRWRSADARLAGRGRVRLPAGGGAPEVDLEAQVEDAVSTRLASYLPVRVMTPATVAWLERAVVRGRAPRGDFVLRGPLDRFPFRDGGGLFQVRFRVEDGVLDYAEGWPRIEAVAADVTFRNQGLEIVASHAAVGGAASHQARAVVADLHEPVIAIEGRLAASAEQAQRFIASSPLQHSLGAYLRTLQVEGPMDVALALTVPVRDAEAAAVDVRATLAGAKVAVVGFPLVADEVSGEVRFTRDAIASERLTGRLFGAPFVARIGAPPRAVDAMARIEIDGGADVRAVAQALALPLERHLRGATALRGEVDLPRGGGEALTVALRTDLAGIAVELPAPFGKAAAAAVPLRGSLRFAGDGLVARVDHASGSVALYALERTRRGWALAPGEGAAHVTVVAPELDLDAWLALLTGPDAEPKPNAARGAPRRAAAVELPLRRLDARAPRLRFAGTTSIDAGLTARRDGAAWQAEVSGSAFAGSVTIPDDRVVYPIALDMERLWLAEDGANAPPAPPPTTPPEPGPDPRKLPGFLVRADSLRLAGADLGAVEAHVERRASGLFLTRFEGRTLTHAVDGIGRWEWTERGPQTVLVGKLVSSDVRVSLTALGAAAPLEAERGRLEADVRWPGAPWIRPFARMGGKLKVAVGKGQLVDIAPGGTGRLVGLMSLNALPRRLRLDFSDVFRKGFSFDSIEGEFVVEEGDAFTDGAVIKGPAATVTIIGRAGLEKRDYDQLATVDAGLGSTLPIVGAIAGGLTGGAVMLLFSQVFKSPLKAATRARYRITGPWGDPKIEQVAAQDPAPPVAPEAKP